MSPEPVAPPQSDYKGRSLSLGHNNCPDGAGCCGGRLRTVRGAQPVRLGRTHNARNPSRAPVMQRVAEASEGSSDSTVLVGAVGAADSPPMTATPAGTAPQVQSQGAAAQADRPLPVMSPLPLGQGRPNDAVPGREWVRGAFRRSSSVGARGILPSENVPALFRLDQNEPATERADASLDRGPICSVPRGPLAAAGPSVSRGVANGPLQAGGAAGGAGVAGGAAAPPPPPLPSPAEEPSELPQGSGVPPSPPHTRLGAAAAGGPSDGDPLVCCTCGVLPWIRMRCTSVSTSTRTVQCVVISSVSRAPAK